MPMKWFATWGFAAFCFTTVVAQQPTRVYYNSKDKPLKSPNSAAYYKETMQLGDTLIVNTFNPSGLPITSGVYLNQTEKVGIWTIYNKQGKKVSAITYVANKRNGPCSFFHANGTIVKSGNFSNEWRDGTWLLFDSTGRKEGRLTYRNDSIVSQVAYDYYGNAIEDAARIYDDPEAKADKQPSFVGGAKAMNKYIKRELKYPEEAKELEQQGRVLVKFVIGVNGEVRDIEVLNSGPLVLKREAVRVVANMPRWIPGTRNGIPVSVKMTTTIVFKL